MCFLLINYKNYESKSIEESYGWKLGAKLDNDSREQQQPHLGIPRFLEVPLGLHQPKMLQQADLVRAAPK